MLSAWNFDWAGTGCFLGLVFGLIFGIFSGILVFGFSATVVHIAETNDKILLKLEEVPNIMSRNASATINNFSTKIEENSNPNDNFANNSFSSEKKDVSSEKSTGSANSQNNVWVCTKCGATNPVGSVLCQSCGH